MVWNAWLGVSRVRADGPVPHRIAVVVGANAAAPGRKPLRFSQADATAFGRVLVELGGFAPNDVHVLLDPDPAQVLGALDGELSHLQGETLVVFYYSGHADATALYPHGRPLTFASLRERLSDSRASLRIGIIDACRGGGWTGTKGLTETAPFEVNLPMVLDNEGSVLIASSSGLEDAHESETLGGSFFTHYWNAGLRGAADTDADGRITLAEAFDYAKALTIRDSALYTASPQHPSFAMNLRGRQDLTLAKLGAADAVLTVEQHVGPLELVHLGSGIVVLEIPKGERSLRLAVAPGRYVLRRREDQKTWARELVVRAGQTTRIDEARLDLLGETAMAIKPALPRPTTATTLPAGRYELTAAFGVNHSETSTGLNIGSTRKYSFSLSMPHGFTDRLQWSIPTLSLTYRFGERGGLEWIPWGGLVGWDVGYTSWSGLVLAGAPGVGLDLRVWTSFHSSFDFGVRFSSHFRWRSGDGLCKYRDPNDIAVVCDDDDAPFAPKTWRASVTAGYTHTLADSVTLHFAVSLSQNVLYEGSFPRFGPSRAENDWVLGIGSVQVLALRAQPLVRVHINDTFALNFDAALRKGFAQRRFDDTYSLGFNVFW
jgi:hypothetical protein